MRDFTVREDSVLCGLCGKRFDGSDAAIVNVADDKKSVSIVHDVCEKNASMKGPSKSIGGITV